MQAKTIELVQAVRNERIAIGAFNTYNLETTRAIVRAAENLKRPVIVQLGVPAIQAGGEPVARAILAAAAAAAVPVAVHLDHCPDLVLVERCFEWGFSSALADGSHLPLAENTAFTRQAVGIAQRFDGSIEAELGRLSGTEDGITIEEVEASLTDPGQARRFVEETGAAMLAVSIGNLHGYSANPPPLNFARLEEIAAVVSLPLVLHGASGLPETDTRRAINSGVAKLNVNTEVRVAFLEAIAGWAGRVGPKPDPRRKGEDLLDLMNEAVRAAEAVVAAKIRAFSLSG